MESPHHQSSLLQSLCSQLSQNELGMWISSEDEKCFYPKDGQRRYMNIEEDSFWFVHRRDCILATMKRHPPGELILDVGGGNGFNTLGLQKAGYNAVLLEPNRMAAMNALQRGISQIICSTIENAHFAERSIPAIGLFDVIEHIEDDISFLKTIQSLLRTKGKLYVTVPALPGLWSFEDRYAEHFRRYTLSTLSRRLEECGFAILQATYFFSYLPPFIFLRKTLPSRLGWDTLYTHEQTRREHVIKSGVKKKMLKMLHTQEIRKIHKGKKIFCGSSILVSARSIERKEHKQHENPF